VTYQPNISSLIFNGQRKNFPLPRTFSRYAILNISCSLTIMHSLRFDKRSLGCCRPYVQFSNMRQEIYSYHLSTMLLFPYCHCHLSTSFPEIPLYVNCTSNCLSELVFAIFDHGLQSGDTREVRAKNAYYKWKQYLIHCSVRKSIADEQLA
jgi:hypothetical protein